ncbi:hypothetical protein D3C80_748940 [compost metagenome]
MRRFINFSMAPMNKIFNQLVLGAICGGCIGFSYFPFQMIPTDLSELSFWFYIGIRSEIFISCLLGFKNFRPKR